jgi:hypothetical protein
MCYTMSGAIMALITKSPNFPKLYSTCIAKLNFEKNNDNDNYEMEIKRCADIVDIVGLTIILENDENLEVFPKMGILLYENDAYNNIVIDIDINKYYKKEYIINNQKIINIAFSDTPYLSGLGKISLLAKLDYYENKNIGMIIFPNMNIISKITLYMKYIYYESHVRRELIDTNNIKIKIENNIIPYRHNEILPNDIFLDDYLYKFNEDYIMFIQNENSEIIKFSNNNSDIKIDKNFNTQKICNKYSYNDKEYYALEINKNNIINQIIIKLNNNIEYKLEDFNIELCYFYDIDYKLGQQDKIKHNININQFVKFAQISKILKLQFDTNLTEYLKIYNISICNKVMLLISPKINKNIQSVTINLTNIENINLIEETKIIHLTDEKEEKIIERNKEQMEKINNEKFISKSFDFNSFIYKIDVLCQTINIKEIKILLNGLNYIIYDTNMLKLFSNLKEDQFTLHLGESDILDSLLHSNRIYSIQLHITYDNNAVDLEDKIKCVAYGYKRNTNLMLNNYDDILNIDNICQHEFNIELDAIVL